MRADKGLNMAKLTKRERDDLCDELLAACAQDDVPTLQAALDALKVMSDEDKKAMLNSGGPYDNPLITAIKQSKNLAIIEALIKAGADPAPKLKGGRSEFSIPLVAAVLASRLDVVTCLVEAGATLNDLCDSTEVFLPANWAIKGGKTDIIDYFIENKLMDVKLIEAENNGTRPRLNPLHVAIDVDDIETVKKLIAYGFGIEVKDKWGKTPLQLAARRGHFELVKYLKGLGADIHAQSSQNKTILDKVLDSRFTRSGRRIYDETPNIEMVEYLLAQGVAVNDKPDFIDAALCSGNDALYSALTNANIIDMKNSTHFLYALEGNNDKIIQDFFAADCPIPAEAFNIVMKRKDKKLFNMLLKRKADVNALINDTYSPLYFAATYGLIDYAKALVEEGAKPDPKALFKAAEFGQTDFVKYFLDQGLGPNTTNEKGHNVCYHMLTELPKKTDRIWKVYGIEPDYAACFALLLPKTKHLTAKNKAKTSLLQTVAKTGNLALVKAIVEAKPELVVQADYYGVTPLHEAAKAGHPDIVKFLCDEGAKLEARSRYEYTPLLMATDPKTIDCLCQLGADMTAKNVDGNTLAHILILKKIDGLKPAFATLKKNKFDFTQVNNQGETILDSLVCAGQCNSLATIRKNYALQIDLSKGDHEGRTLLHKLLIRSGKIDSDIMQWLEAEGVDIHAKTSKQFTALHFAAMKHSLDAVKLLLALKLDPNSQTSRGNTPLHFAVKTHLYEADSASRNIEHLLLNNARTDIPNRYGETAPQLALRLHGLKNATLLFPDLALESAAEVNKVTLCEPADNISALKEKEKEKEEDVDAISFNRAVKTFKAENNMKAITEIYDSFNPQAEDLREKFYSTPTILQYLTRKKGPLKNYRPVYQSKYEKNCYENAVKERDTIIPFRAEHCMLYDPDENDLETKKWSSIEEWYFHQGTTFEASALLAKKYHANVDNIYLEYQGSISDVGARLKALSCQKDPSKRGKHLYVFPTKHSEITSGHAFMVAALVCHDAPSLLCVMFVNSWQSKSYTDHMALLINMQLPKDKPTTVMDVSLEIQVNLEDQNCGLYSHNFAVTLCEAFEQDKALGNLFAKYPRPVPEKAVEKGILLDEPEKVGCTDRFFNQGMKLLSTFFPSSVSATCTIWNASTSSSSNDNEQSVQSEEKPIDLVALHKQIKDQLQKSMKSRLPQYYNKANDGSFTVKTADELMTYHSQLRWEVGNLFLRDKYEKKTDSSSEKIPGSNLHFTQPEILRFASQV